MVVEREAALVVMDGEATEEVRVAVAMAVGTLVGWTGKEAMAAGGRRRR